MGSLVSVDGLEVHHVPDDVILVADSVTPEHVPALPGDGQGLSAVVPLQDGDHLRHQLPLLLESPELEAAVEAEADLSHGVRQLLLDELVGPQGSPELLPVHDVVPGLLHTELCSTKTAPSDA